MRHGGGDMTEGTDDLGRLVLMRKLMCQYMGHPARARRIAGASAAAREMVPWSRSRRSMARTTPGTPAECPPAIRSSKGPAGPAVQLHGPAAQAAPAQKELSWKRDGASSRPSMAMVVFVVLRQCLFQNQAALMLRQ